MLPAEWIQSVDFAPLRRKVLRWYGRHGRDLPWRNTTDAYRILVSEVMLQQTQIATVLRYYGRFLLRFPTLAALAEADVAEVLLYWQGLGYYRRARNLHQVAKIATRDLGAQLPNDPDVLQGLPGLGRYTTNAVLSMAFGRKAPILETNTVRLWTRICGSPGDPSREPLKRELWRVAEAALPSRNAGIFNQALMDIGSTVCTPVRPQCARCPFEAVCAGYALGAPEQFPAPKAKPIVEHLHHVAVVIWNGHRVLLTQCSVGGLWEGLWEFPRIEKRPRESWIRAARRASRTLLGVDVAIDRELITVRHTVTRYRVVLKTFEARIVGSIGPSIAPQAGNQIHRWVELSEIEGFALSSPQKRIADFILAYSRSPLAPSVVGER